MLDFSDIPLFLLFLIPLILKDRKGFIVFLAAAVLVFILKFAFAIPRPCSNCLDDFGYPSGHAVLSILVYLVYRRRFGPILLLIVLFFTLHRIFFNYHDVKQIIGSFGFAYVIYSFFFPEKTSAGNHEDLRKLLHVLLGFFAYFLILAGFYWTFYGIIMIILALERLHLPIGRKGENALLTVLRHWSSFLFVSYFFSPIEILAIAVPLYIGDAFATIFGFPARKKTLAGSLGVFVSTLVLYPILGAQTILYAILMTLTELFSPDDNIFMPLVAGLFFWVF